MSRVFLRRPGRAGLPLLVLVGALTAAPSATAAPCSFRLELQGGAALLDRNLQRYDLDAQSGDARALRACAELAGWSLGARLGRFHTRHELVRGGVGLAPVSADVAWSIREISVGRNLLSLGGFAIDLGAGAGRVRLAHEPNRVAIEVAPGTSTVVELAPVDESIYSVGLGAHQRVAGPISLELAADRYFLRLSTAERVGSELVERRVDGGITSARVGVGLEIHP